MEVSHFSVMWKFSALHPTLHWRPVQARTAGWSIYAQTHQLLLAYLLVPEEVCLGGLEVSGSSWKEPSKRGGSIDGRMNVIHTLGAKTSHCSPDLRVISEKGTDSDGFPLMYSKARTNDARNGPFCPLSP